MSKMRKWWRGHRKQKQYKEQEESSNYTINIFREIRLGMAFMK